MIGIGGFGKVWKVKHKKSNISFAMKEMNKALIISTKSVNSVMNERALLTKLKHEYFDLYFFIINLLRFLVNMITAF